MRNQLIWITCKYVWSVWKPWSPLVGYLRSYVTSSKFRDDICWRWSLSWFNSNWLQPNRRVDMHPSAMMPLNSLNFIEKWIEFEIDSKVCVLVKFEQHSNDTWVLFLVPVAPEVLPKGIEFYHTWRNGPFGH